jgi:hypothetical protein
MQHPLVQARATTSCAWLHEIVAWLMRMDAGEDVRARSCRPIEVSDQVGGVSLVVEEVGL